MARPEEDWKAVLNHLDVLRSTTNKHYKFIKSIGNHEPQPVGLERDIYNFDEELDGYTSPGGTVKMTKGVASMVFIAIAADASSRLVLKARQEAYEQVTRQAEALAKIQQEAYEEQQRKIALEHKDQSHGENEAGQ
jgi:hypothetical protein